MVGSRRDTLKILSDLLKNMTEPRRITHLLYISNLSYSQLVKYTKMVTEMGLAKKQTQPFSCYSVTEEGMFFINMVNKRKEKIKVILNRSK